MVPNLLYRETLLLRICWAGRLLPTAAACASRTTLLQSTVEYLLIACTLPCVSRTTPATKKEVQGSASTSVTTSASTHVTVELAAPREVVAASVALDAANRSPQLSFPIPPKPGANGECPPGRRPYHVVMTAATGNYQVNRQRRLRCISDG